MLKLLVGWMLMFEEKNMRLKINETDQIVQLAILEFVCVSLKRRCQMKQVKNNQKQCFCCCLGWSHYAASRFHPVSLL